MRPQILTERKKKSKFNWKSLNLKRFYCDIVFIVKINGMHGSIVWFNLSFEWNFRKIENESRSCKKKNNNISWHKQATNTQTLEIRTELFLWDLGCAWFMIYGIIRFVLRNIPKERC